MTPKPISGDQHVLRAGDYTASIASVGASLRELKFGERDLVVPFTAHELRPAHRGATLAPWPNRVVDGKYVFEGTEQQLALTEPSRGHALHGLVSWNDFTVVNKGPNHVTLLTTVEPQAGYPWRISVEAAFVLSTNGLTQTVRARNESGTPAPWGTGPHPYLVAGPGRVDDWILRLPASQVLAVTSDRLAPIFLVSVESNPRRFDYRTPRTIGAERVDHAFTGFVRDADGMATAELTTEDGSGVALAWNAQCPWVQIHTADLLVGEPGHRIGLAAEPMTCAPDAFNVESYDFDTGLQTINPGERTPPAAWTIRALPASEKSS